MSVSRFSPKRRLALAAGVVSGIGAALPISSSVWANGSTNSMPSLLHKGVSLSDWFQYSRKSKPAVSQLAGLCKAGVDHVRLPVDPHFLGWRPDAAVSEPIFSKLNELDEAIRTITKAGLIVNLDFHPGQESIEYLKQNRLKAEPVLIRSLTSLVRRYKHLGEGAIYFELMNEPHRFYPNAGGWNALQAKLIKAVRQETQDHWLVVNGVWDPLSSFRTLDVYTDKHLLYSFHFYKPYVVTHQGAKWEPSAAKLFPYLEAVPYPSRRIDVARQRLKPGANEDYVRGELAKYKNENWDIDRIRKEIGVSIAWARQHKVPIICTEFGVMRGSIDAASRLKWLADVATVFGENGVPWTLWDYCNDFGIAQCGSQPTVIEPDVAKALGLRV